MNGLLQTLRNLGPVRLTAIVAVLAACGIFFAFVTTRIATPGFALLYANLDLRDSGQIVQKLEATGVTYQLRGDGTSIMVPQDQVARLRMLLADEGMPHGGSVGYEIFDKSETFGTSNFIENINQVRALEGELARTISSINLVQSARVHLVLPRREVFTRDKQPPSASIVLKLRSAERLSPPHVAAIQHLVAAAVPDLVPSRVSVVDTDGNLLASGDGTSQATLTGTNAEELRVNYENRLARKLEELIERSVGPGKARVDVHVDMDFDRITTNSESYDPNGQVVRSTQTVAETNDNNEGGGQPVTVSSNLPNAQGTTPAPAAAAAARSRGSRNEETVNYEITKTVRNQVREAGNVQRQSVAVLVDGNYSTDKDGTKKYEPRSADEMKQLTALVRSAIGYDEKRGDSVEVANMRFAGVEEPAAAPPDTIMGFEKPDLIKLGETGVLAVVAILVLLLVVRPMINRLLESASATSAADAGRLLTAGGAARAGGTAALPAPAGSAGSAGGSPGLVGGPRIVQSDNGDMIDMSQVEGRVAGSALRKVGEIVEKHPEEAVAIVRSWMYQDSR